MRSLFIVAAFALVAGCAKNPENPGTMNVRTNSAVAPSIASHKTYAFQKVAPPPPGDAQWDGAPAALAEVKAKIDEEMQARGYVLAAKPELMVRISLGVHDTLREPTGAAANTRTDVPAIKETTTDLAIDIFDYSNGGQLFHGQAGDELHHREVSDDKLAKAVRLILEPVPPAER